MTVCAAPDQQSQTVVAPDGLGGLTAAWNDYRRGHTVDVYRQRVLADGAVTSVGSVASGITGELRSWPNPFRDRRRSNSRSGIHRRSA